MRKILLLASTLSLLTLGLTPPAHAVRLNRFGIVMIPCGGVEDETPLVQDYLNSAAAINATVEPPTGIWCRVDEGVYATTGVGWYGNGGGLDASHMASGGVGLTIYSINPGANYTGTQQQWANLNMKGPGRSSNSTGILVKASNWGINGFNIHDFGSGISYGDHGYGDKWQNGELYNNHIDVWCPNGGQIVNAGEQNSFSGVNLYNSDIGVGNGSCTFSFYGGSMDAMSQYTGYACSPTDLTNENIEIFSTGPLWYACGGNTSGSLNVVNSRFISEGNYNIPIFSVAAGGPYLNADGNYFSGLSNGNAGSSYVTGAGAATGARLCHSTGLGTVPFNIQDFGPC